MTTRKGSGTRRQIQNCRTLGREFKDEKEKMDKEMKEFQKYRYKDEKPKSTNNRFLRDKDQG